MATAYDVARVAGVSVGTVSRYLNGKGYVGAETREKIASAITELGFIPNRAAASLTTKTTGLLGFVASDLRNPFTAEIASALGHKAREEGYGLVVYESADDARLAIEGIDLMRSHGADGLVVTPPESKLLNSALVEAARFMPVVGIGLRTNPLVTDVVTTDTELGATDAMRYLLSLGHERIAYVGSATMASGRYKGYRSALEEASIPVDESLVVVGPLTWQAGFAALPPLMEQKQPPTAIFAANDVVALGVLQAAHTRGMKLPEELSVVGYDDVDPARHSEPALTTVAQPLKAMGSAAVGLLVARIRKVAPDVPQQAVLPAELVIRNSTCPPVTTKKKGNKA